MTNVPIAVNPDDHVRLAGTRKVGRVLDWATQNPAQRRALEQAFVAVQLLHDGQIGYWSRQDIELVKRHIQPLPPSEDFPFRP